MTLESLTQIIKDIFQRLNRLENLRIYDVIIPNTGKFIFPKSSADPASPTQGQVYFNTSTNKLKVYTGSSWVDLH